jgi:trans-2,3-dihydro-3-hydroxyanthranilate isomerase
LTDKHLEPARGSQRDDDQRLAQTEVAHAGREEPPLPQPAVYLYEAFAARPFGGNPAAVVMLDEPKPDAWLLGVASDLGAPTTGFVDLLEARPGHVDVRFFTPHREINACGHVTVAIAAALVETGSWTPGPAVVGAPGGRYELMLHQDDSGRVQVEMEQQLRHLSCAPVGPPLDALLGDARRHRTLPVIRAGTGLSHLLVPVDSVAAYEVDTIGVYTITSDTPSPVAVRMRDLCAAIGATEEPASGTTSGALALALAQIGVLGARSPTLDVEMGIEMGRPSRLLVDVDTANPTMARLRGSAARVLTGRLEKRHA